MNKEFPKKLPKSMNPYNKPTPKPTKYGSTYTFKDKKTGEMGTGSIEGRWIIPVYQGDPGNTMYEFLDGLRYTYY